MTKRKITLIAVLVFLCVVYVIQLVISSGNRIKNFNLKESPDEITVMFPDKESFTLLKQTDSSGNEKWIIHGKNYEADPVAVKAMTDSLESIKSLGKVSSQTDGARFGLDSSSALSVSVSAGGSALCSVKIGNASTTGTQTYGVINGTGGVQLISGNLRDTFDKTIEELRNRLIFSVDQALVSKITVENQNGNFVLEKTGEPPLWNFNRDGVSGTPAQADSEKAASWVSSIVKLTALSFEEETAPIPETPAAGTVSFTLPDGEISLTLYKPEEEGSVYTAVSSASPWIFKLSSYTAERYLKNPEELKVQAGQ